jgi:hypothetical protein
MIVIFLVFNGGRDILDDAARCGLAIFFIEVHRDIKLENFLYEAKADGTRIFRCFLGLQWGLRHFRM